MRSTVFSASAFLLFASAPLITAWTTERSIFMNRRRQVGSVYMLFRSYLPLIDHVGRIAIKQHARLNFLHLLILFNLVRSVHKNHALRYIPPVVVLPHHFEPIISAANVFPLAHHPQFQAYIPSLNPVIWRVIIQEFGKYLSRDLVFSEWGTQEDPRKGACRKQMATRCARSDGSALPHSKNPPHLLLSGHVI